MCGVCSGLIALSHNDPDFPDFVNYHCVIHQQAVEDEVVDISLVMTLVVKLMNSIRAKALQHCLFKALLEEDDGDLLLHVRCLCATVPFLLRPEIKTFLSAWNNEHKEL